MRAEKGAHRAGTETCLFTTMWVNICLVQKKKREKKESGRERNGSIDAFGAAANPDD